MTTLTATVRRQLGLVVLLEFILPADDECAALDAPSPQRRGPEWTAWFAAYVDAELIRFRRYKHFLIIGMNYENEPVRVVSNIHRFLFQLAGPVSDLQIAAMHEAEAFRAFLAAEADRLESEAERHDAKSVGAYIRAELAAALRRFVGLILAGARSLSTLDPADLPGILTAGGQSARYVPLA